jgi:urease accessory protein
MQRATQLLRKADLKGRISVDTITLDRVSRYRRRIALTSDRGHEFLLDLPEATYMADGDGLVLESGVLMRVVAAAEPLLEIHAHDVAALARIAWHIGNRHTPAEVTASAIYIQPDHVLEEMVTGLGAHVHHVQRPFEPEGGAYGGKGPLEHGHHHRAESGHHGHHHGDLHGDRHSHDQSHVHGRQNAHGHDSNVHAHIPPAAKPAVWRPE